MHDLINNLSDLKNKDTDKFELFDGGHCYLRAIKDHDGTVSLHRFPNRVNAADVVLLGEWAKSLDTGKLPTTTMTISCDENVSANTLIAFLTHIHNAACERGGKGIRLVSKAERVRALMLIEEVYSDHIIVSCGKYTVLTIPLSAIPIDDHSRLSPGRCISAYINSNTPLSSEMAMDKIVVER